YAEHSDLHSFPTRRSSDLGQHASTKDLLSALKNGNEAVIRQLLNNGVDLESKKGIGRQLLKSAAWNGNEAVVRLLLERGTAIERSEEHTSELQSLRHLVCR